jgi:hypothetical protein
MAEYLRSTPSCTRPCTKYRKGVTILEIQTKGRTVILLLGLLHVSTMLVACQTKMCACLDSTVVPIFVSVACSPCTLHFITAVPDEAMIIGSGAIIDPAVIHVIARQFTSAHRTRRQLRCSRCVSLSAKLQNCNRANIYVDQYRFLCMFGNYVGRCLGLANPAGCCPAWLQGPASNAVV